ncbi:MAG: signal peptidase I, partial [Candidatus Portnoybacteria bacterium CG06_land_8_20_14_3_00_39_12]
EPCAEIECEYIKRIIGLPGDRVMVKQNQVYINGQALDESNYLAGDIITGSGSFLAEGVEKTIGDNSYLPLGDNRPYSRDGREFGVIMRDMVIGRAWLRYWPLNKAGFVKHLSYK